MAATAETLSDDDVVVTRVFNAPRRFVFAAWTRAEHFCRWYGPKDFTVPACTMDARVGGTIRLCMRAPDGEDTWILGTFRELIAPERLVVAAALIDRAGRPRVDLATTVTFQALGRGTKLMLRSRVVAIHDSAAAAQLDGMEQDWRQALDRLAARLSSLTT